MIMKKWQTNHHLEINASDIYCLCGDRVGALLDSSVLTSVLSPPPPTLLLNITTQNDKTTLKVLAVGPLLCPHVHFGSSRVFIVTLGRIFQRPVNRYDV